MTRYWICDYTGSRGRPCLVEDRALGALADRNGGLPRCVRHHALVATGAGAFVVARNRKEAWKQLERDEG